VLQVSSDSFTDPTGGASNPIGQQPSISTQAPQNLGTAPVYYYTARISIDRLQLKRQPPAFKIVPGMPIEADIRIGRRTILQYMFDRVIPFLSEGMREPA
jgi:membrane fusion protein, hemolysin D